MNETTRAMQEKQEWMAKQQKVAEGYGMGAGSIAGASCDTASDMNAANCGDAMPTPQIVQDLRRQQRVLETRLSDTRNRLNIVTDLLRVFEDR